MSQSSLHKPFHHGQFLGPLLEPSYITLECQLDCLARHTEYQYGVPMTLCLLAIVSLSCPDTPKSPLREVKQSVPPFYELRLLSDVHTKLGLALDVQQNVASLDVTGGYDQSVWCTPHNSVFCRYR